MLSTMFIMQFQRVFVLLSIIWSVTIVKQYVESVNLCVNCITVLFFGTLMLTVGYLPWPTFHTNQE